MIDIDLNLERMKIFRTVRNEKSGNFGNPKQSANLTAKITKRSRIEMSLKHRNF